MHAPAEEAVMYKTELPDFRIFALHGLKHSHLISH